MHRRRGILLERSVRKAPPLELPDRIRAYFFRAQVYES